MRLAREAAFAAEFSRDVLDDAPVFTGRAGTFNRLVDFDNAAFNLCDNSFIFFLERTGQYDIRMLRAFIHEEINRNIEIQFI